MKHFITCLVLLAACSLISRGETKQAGSRLDVAHGVSNTESVFVGRFITVGRKTIGSLGASNYIGADLEVLRLLAGESIEAGRYKAQFRTLDEPSEAAESIPQVGVEYVLFGRAGGSLISVTKIVDATTENMRQVQSSAAMVGRFDDQGHKKEPQTGTKATDRSHEGRPNNTAVKDGMAEHTEGHYLVAGFIIGPIIIGVGAYFLWSARRRAHR